MFQISLQEFLIYLNIVTQLHKHIKPQYVYNLNLITQCLCTNNKSKLILFLILWQVIFYYLLFFMIDK